MSNCESCFPAELPECIDAFTLKGKLTASTDYKWTITDKFGNRLSGLATSNVGGDIILSDSSFNKLLRSFSGSFKLEFFLIDSTVPVTMTMCDTKDYNCINFTLYKENGISSPAIIGECEGV